MTAPKQHLAAGLSYIACDGSGGLPVVMLHGIGSNAQSFVPLMLALDGSHPTLAWNAPGYGDSQPLAVDWPDAGDYATVLDRLLAHLDVSRCILVGHSLGTLIAARFALVSPSAGGGARSDLACTRLRHQQGGCIAARGGGSAR